MRQSRRIYAWVLVLCLTVGVCAPLLLYQFIEPELKVSSVVTLNYDAPYRELQDPTDPNSWGEPELQRVKDLTAPDGEELDLNQITSSFVLQQALSGMELSQPISVSALRSNIEIQRILTKESYRQQEMVDSIVEQKNTAAYTQMLQEMELIYDSKFVVTLINGFGEEDSRNKTELKESELKILLDRILSAYNRYLVSTYLEAKLPDDEISMIDTDNLEVIESLDLLRTAEQHLYAYCDEKEEDIKAYRSYRTGKSLTDWMETLNTVVITSTDDLNAYVLANGIVEDREALLNRYQYELRNAQAELEEIQTKIADLGITLQSYKNDEIFVSMQNGEAEKTTQASTELYNELVISQAANYEMAAQTETRIASIEAKIEVLNNPPKESISSDAVKMELKQVLDTADKVFLEIKTHMEELLTSAGSTQYAEASDAQGENPGFLAASLKNMILGLVAGAVIAVSLWFLSAFLPELQGTHGTEWEKEGEQA